MSDGKCGPRWAGRTVVADVSQRTDLRRAPSRLELPVLRWVHASVDER
jgi:hypothetical protein